MVINCLGEDIKKYLVKDMSSSPFSLMIDGSNDTGLEKMFSISIHIFDVNFNWVMNNFFDMNMHLRGQEMQAQLSLCLEALTIVENDLSLFRVSCLGI